MTGSIQWEVSTQKEACLEFFIMPAESSSSSYGMNVPLKLLAHISFRQILDQTLICNYPSSLSWYLLMWKRGTLLESTVVVKLSTKAALLNKYVLSGTILQLTVWFLCPFPAKLSTPTVFNCTATESCFVTTYFVAVPTNCVKCAKIHSR